MIECKTCGIPYLGETSKTLRTRIIQHQYCVRKKDASNGIFQLVRSNKTHIIDWDNAMVLDKESQWFRRRIKESIFITLKNKEVEISNLMNIEKGLEIDPGWNSIFYDTEFARMMDKMRRAKNEEKIDESVLEIKAMHPRHAFNMHTHVEKLALINPL